MALNGQEIVLVQGVQANGVASGQQVPATTAQIASAGSGLTTTTVITVVNAVAGTTIPAAAIFGKISSRTGLTANGSDTTDTAAAIILAMGNGAVVGGSFRYVYENNTSYVVTLGGGVGVTVSGVTSIPPNSWVEYLVTENTSSTITMVAYGVGNFTALGTFVANGTTAVVVANAKVTATSTVDITLKTVGGTVGAVPIITTITPGTGFTITASAADTSTYNYAITN